MTSTPDQPSTTAPTSPRSAKEIDELKAIPEEELVNPTPAGVEDREPTPRDRCDRLREVGRPGVRGALED